MACFNPVSAGYELEPQSLSFVPDPVQIGQRVGNYVVERLLARGGMGSVFVGRHPALDREVAIKFLAAEATASPRYAKRFLNEARITASLRHPNIVEIFDFGELDGRYYYVMELLRGQSLATLMREQGRFSVEQLARFMAQICSALDAAHAAGVVHRDLKPDNVFVLQTDPLRTKLMDFGVAKLLARGDAQTQYGEIMGTPSHMAPEQALGHLDRICPQTDLYALGAIAYEMLTGSPVFQEDSPLMLMLKHVKGSVRPIHEHVPEVNARVAALVESCLAKDPADRPCSASWLAMELAHAARVARDAAQRHGPTPARPGHPDPVPRPEARPAPPVRAAAPPEPLRAHVPWRVIERLQAEPPKIERSDVAASQTESPGPRAQDRGAEGIAFSAAERANLTRQLQLMEQSGDFPAFVRSVSEITEKADASGSCSAGQLGALILRDRALTAKLLRVVNRTYAHRFGGKVLSVQHAILILGFDQVRSIALSISLFKNSNDKRHARQIADSAVHALVSGEVARTLASRAGVTNPELAMLCGMFHKLGQHVVVAYLPELYEKLRTLSDEQQTTLDAAAETILGLSLRKLGLGLMQRWRLPARMVDSLGAVVPLGSNLTHETLRLGALADLSNSLCEIVSAQRGVKLQQELGALLARHKNLVALDRAELPELLATVQESFERRYASLGLNATQSPFSRAVSVFPAEATGAAEQRGVPSVRFSQRAFCDLGPSRAKPSDPAARYRLLQQRTAEVDAALKLGYAPDRILCMALRAVADYLDLPRVLALAADRARRELAVRCGVGEAAEALGNTLAFPLQRPRALGNVFSTAYHHGKDVVVSDAFDERIASRIPPTYYEALGSPAFVVLCCKARGRRILLLADVPAAEQLPTPERLAALDEMRTLTALAVL
ncbi:MAG: HDOD domain-containing protein [Polyangiaceae bacterium]|nr:HDOD domain-containing protein [Polyangiaceae bacterium]